MRKLYHRLATWNQRRKLRKRLDLLAGCLTHYRDKAVADEYVRTYEYLKRVEATYA